MLFDVCGSEHCKRPEEVTEVGIDEHSMGHAADGEVCAFSDTILRGGIRDHFLIDDSLCLAIGFHLPLYEF